MGVTGVIMRKEGSFDNHWGEGWPDLENIKSCLLDPERRAQFFAKGRDGGSLSAKGLYGTEGLPARGGLVTANLFLHMNPDHGAKLVYAKWDGRIQKKYSYDSKGDLNRLREFVRSFHGTMLCVGLFIPFEQGWLAIKEFIDTEGELPRAIEWIATEDLPQDIAPYPR